MPTFRLAVTQVVRLVRRTIVEVEAPSLDRAIEIQAESDAPNYDAPVWTDYPELMNEEIGLARDEDEVDLAERSKGDGPQSLRKPLGSSFHLLDLRWLEPDPDSEADNAEQDASDAVRKSGDPS